MLKEYKENKVNLGKKAYEEEMEDLCTDYLIPLLKKHITDETKTPLLVRGLKTFEENGYTDRSKLTKEETKIDLIINEFVNGGLEELLSQKMNKEE